MALSSEIRDRVFAAADALYAEDPTGFPTVEAVRAAARTSMGAAVEGLRAWRERQRQQVQRPVELPLPSALAVVLEQAGRTLWTAAREDAERALRAAQEAFVAEKAELLQVSEQQSEAFDQQAEALAVAQEQCRALQEALATQQEGYTATEEALREEIERLTDTTREQREQIARLEGQLETLAAENAKLLNLLGGKLDAVAEPST
ncbi:DNA-binding protein [Acidithiobacillus sp. IBUN Pt1247-S3]|uniref:DNA-binding protein n=1 Tax=Acidithiobacillus sp. IBUN Pt1247-S3 TaxID=3166642 RepID=UPI0034E5C5F7